MKDKISIIIPIYNAEKYLKKCIDSVIFQSYKNWELILIDDGSTDSSNSISLSYAKNSKIKFVYQKHSGIPGQIRNIGIQISSGKYIMFLDADDYIERDTLSHLYNCYLFYNTDLVICNFKKIKNNEIEERNDNYLSNSKVFNKEEIIKYLISVLDQQNKNIIFNYCWGKLYKTKIIKDNNILFNENLYTYEDIEFNFKYLRFVHTTVYSNWILYNYRIHESTTFNINLKKFFNHIDALKSIKFYFTEYLDKKTLNKKIGRAIISMTIIQLIRASVKGKKSLVDLCDVVIKNKDIRNNLKFYFPKKSESIIIPLLIFFKLKFFLFFYIIYKSKKRYKKI